MKKRLFDFTVVDAVLTCTAYALLLTLFGQVLRTAENKTFPLIIEILLAVSFLLMVWYFCFLAVKITPEGLQQGHKRMPKDHIGASVRYNLRFRTAEIVIRDKTLRYSGLSRREIPRKTFILQASPANLRKLNAYLGLELSVPKDLEKKTKEAARRPAKRPAPPDSEKETSHEETK